LTGIHLKKKFGNKIFWIADYRDPWQFAIYIKKKSFLSDKDILKKWMKKF